MQWGSQQENALVQVNNWIKKKDKPVFRLFGWAGTGKTTLVKHIAEGISGNVVFATFTGKAALVLRQKGCPGARTLHSLIYRPSPSSQATLREYEATLADLLKDLKDKGLSGQELADHQRVRHLREMIGDERKRTSRPHFSVNMQSDLKYADLLVVDEVSMVDPQMGRDLESFGVPILVLGDPGQLPAIGGAGHFTAESPDVLLTEVHRQANDNPLIRLATMARMGQQPPIGEYGDSEVIWLDELKQRSKQVSEADILLVGRNKTRHTSNRRLRELDGVSSIYPVAGDQLVCLRNNHEKGFLNGGLWNVVDADESLSNEDDRWLRVTSQDEPITEDVTAIGPIFTGTDPKEIDFWSMRGKEWFDFGRALTVHKSQGSQWPRGVVIDESAAFRKDRWNHLYTAVTRFSESVLLARSRS